MIAIIGGPGIHEMEMLKNVKNVNVETEYGTVPLKSGEYKGKKIFLLLRHGEDHSLPPHMINYRANIKALKDLKVERIISTSAVGSLKKTIEPGDFVLLNPHQKTIKKSLSVTPYIITRKSVKYLYKRYIYNCCVI